jgi:hypothetical protein
MLLIYAIIFLFIVLILYYMLNRYINKSDSDTGTVSTPTNNNTSNNPSTTPSNPNSRVSQVIVTNNSDLLSSETYSSDNLVTRMIKATQRKLTYETRIT